MSWEAFRFADPAGLWLGLLGPLVVLLAILLCIAKIVTN